LKRKTLLLPSFYVLLLSLTLLVGVTAQAALLQKFHLQNRIQLAVYAIKNKLV